MIFSFTHKGDDYKFVNQDSKFTESIKKGEEIYMDMSYHLPNGEGQLKVYPPLAKPDYLIKKREASIHAIK